MPINIDHSKIGSVTLQASNEAGCSTFTFPSINGESSVLVSGSPISYVSGLQSCLNSIGCENPFGQPNAQAQIGALQQRTNPVNRNYAVEAYSLALGCDAATSYAHEIAQGLDSAGSGGWNQSSQYLFKTSTTTNTVCEIVTGFKIDMRNSLSYIDGKVVAKGNSSYAYFDFCAVIQAEYPNKACMLTGSYFVNTGYPNASNLGFYLQDTVSGDEKYISIKVSGDATPIKWLLCMSDLKLKTS